MGQHSVDSADSILAIQLHACDSTGIHLLPWRLKGERCEVFSEHLHA